MNYLIYYRKRYSIAFTEHDLGSYLFLYWINKSRKRQNFNVLYKAVTRLFENNLILNISLTLFLEFYTTFFNKKKNGISYMGKSYFAELYILIKRVRKKNISVPFYAMYTRGYFTGDRFEYETYTSTKNRELPAKINNIRVTRFYYKTWTPSKYFKNYRSTFDLFNLL